MEYLILRIFIYNNISKTKIVFKIFIEKQNFSCHMPGSLSYKAFQLDCFSKINFIYLKFQNWNL